MACLFEPRDQTKRSTALALLRGMSRASALTQGAAWQFRPDKPLLVKALSSRFRSARTPMQARRHTLRRRDSLVGFFVFLPI